MKLKPTSDQWRVTSGKLKNLPCRTRHASVIPQHSQRGVALVITLIMLSVTLVMAIAFLAISRRERNSVGTNTDTTVARLAADSALAAAQAQIVANILTTNAASYDFHLLVSTNYQNDYGFVQNSQNPTNVNYNYLHGGAALTADDFVQNVANLFFLPRAPVSINGDFRFYLDLNRNGRFETNGYTADFDAFNNPTGFNAKTGDPEWVGILERPDAPHSANNPFVARYAFLAQPIGNSLDLNAIHNQVFYQNINPNTASVVNDGFFRNQGVGSWELNLAAFFADLNTNIWGQTVVPSSLFYEYNLPTTGFANRGYAFDDARALLSYRYGFNYGNLASANFVMGGFANTILPRDNIDTYSDGPLQLTTTNINEGILANQDKPALSWAGANNPNNFFALPSELFDPNKVTANFTNRLRLGTLVSSNASYDRYTFYRLLDQLGTDSSASDSRMNLNYDNITATNSFTGTVGATNLIDWTPLAFFTNAADRLIRTQSANWLAQSYPDYTNTFGTTITQPFSLTNIPVYVNGRFVYTPAVNRLLQLAANIYDASKTNQFPSTFRPFFRAVPNGAFTDVFIAGFNEITSIKASTVTSDPTLLVYRLPEDLGLLSTSIPNLINIYGVPWILGAKKGLPNFQQFYMINTFQATRKLQVQRKFANIPGATETNQMYVMSLTNYFGFSAWNSYNLNYTSASPAGLTILVRDTVSMVLSNGANPGVSVSANWPNPTPQFYSFYTNGFRVWPGSGWGSTPQDFQGNSPAANSFIGANWAYGFLPESTYYPSLSKFVPVVTNQTPLWEVGNSSVPVLSQFLLLTTNRLQAIILDGDQVVDYVQFGGPNSVRDLTDELADKSFTPADKAKIDNHTSMWDTNGYGSANNPTWGVVNQITVSYKGTKSGIPSSEWRNLPNLPNGLPSTVQAESDFFQAFFTGKGFVSGRNTYSNLQLVVQVPYTPTRTVWDYTLLQANDPLVHYTVSDLQQITSDTGIKRDDAVPPASYPNPPTSSLGDKPRYQPWGRTLEPPNGNYDNNGYNLAYRDPLVWGSDFWDFPANKYPSAGWLGRVHRGTPWQTIFLKATNVLEQVNGFGNIGTNTWKLWTGGNQNTYDAVHTAPEQDRLLFDIFTATPNDNAARGTLSVNQNGLAAWSALLSGVVALTNITDTVETPSLTSTPIITNTIISPASVDIANSAVGQIHDAILATRANTNLFPQGVFEHVGDILRVPALTEQSPFLNRGGNEYLNYDLSDEVYEWLPQQTMGLLRLGTPRFVLYCYGQALRPAKDGQVLSGTAFGLVTNYQVVAESATRVVLRVDNTAGKTPQVIVESSNPLPPD